MHLLKPSGRGYGNGYGSGNGDGNGYGNGYGRGQSRRPAQGEAGFMQAIYRVVIQDKEK